jgi:hypothetical protein
MSREPTLRNKFLTQETPETKTAQPDSVLNDIVGI